METVVIQRTLDANAIWKRLKSVSFLKDTLAGPHARLRQKQTLKEHLQRVLKNYEKYFAGAQPNTVRYGMILASILSGVGRALANAYNDPSLQPVLTRELVTLFGSDIQATLTGGDTPATTEEAAGAVRLAGVIGGENVFELYLKDKIRPEDAVLRIRTMALKADVEPSAMYDLLNQQFQIEMGAYKFAEVQAGHLRKDPGRGVNFPLENLIGEISPTWFENMFLPNLSDKPAWHSTPYEGIQLRPAAQSRLDLLRLEVAAWDGANEELRAKIDPALLSAKSTKEATAELKTPSGPSAPSLPLPGLDQGLADELAKAHQARQTRLASGTPKVPTDYIPPPGPAPMTGESMDAGWMAKSLTPKQYAHLRELEREEQVRDEATKPSKHSTALDAIADLLRDEYPAYTGKTRADVMPDVRKILGAMNTMELTLTVSARSLFSAGPTPAYGTEYGSTQAIRRRDVPTSEIFGRSDVRGGGSQEERIAVYQSDRTEQKQRGVNYMRWRRDKDERQTRYRGFTTNEWAKFAALHATFKSTFGASDKRTFGNCIFVLKDSVRQRATFSYGTECPERRSMAVLFNDILSAYRSTHDKAHKVVLDAIILNAVGKGGHVEGYLSFEVEAHIYGALNLVTDVKAIYVTPKLGPTTAKNVDEFASNNGIPIHRW